ncbi:MAG: hypothetical protein FWD35_00700 [Oscillospiraceae bacterium]|nr:hypothetical protein [Oscillospiraceae bacterium]
MIKVCKVVNQDLPGRRVKGARTPYYEALIHIAPAFDVEFCICKAEDFDLKAKTVNGLFLNKGSYERRIVPIPPIIDNSPNTVQKLGGREAMSEYAFIIRRSFGFDKLKQYNLLMKSPEFMHLAIPTRKANELSVIHESFDEFGDEIVLKPQAGKQGRSVYGLRRIKNEYTINGIEFGSKAKFDDYVEGSLFTLERFIAQPRIKSRLDGRPFDVRIHTIRTARNRHEHEIFARLGGAGRVAANRHLGGAVLPPEFFFGEHFPEQAESILEELKVIGNKLPLYIQKQLSFPIFDTGIDIGFEISDKGCSMKMYETNSFPGAGMPSALGRVNNLAIAMMKCYHYIDERIRVKSEQAKQGDST